MSRLADKIRQSDDRVVEIIDVPEWDVKIELRSMTALQRSLMQVEWADTEEQSAAVLYQTVLQHCCFDPDTGDQVFNEEDSEWILAEKSAQVVDRVAQACLKVSGLSADSIDESGKDSLGSVEEIQS